MVHVVHLQLVKHWNLSERKKWLFWHRCVCTLALSPMESDTKVSVTCWDDAHLLVCIYLFIYFLYFHYSVSMSLNVKHSNTMLRSSDVKKWPKQTLRWMLNVDCMLHWVPFFDILPQEVTRKCREMKEKREGSKDIPHFSLLCTKGEEAQPERSWWDGEGNSWHVDSSSITHKHTGSIGI